MHLSTLSNALKEQIVIFYLAKANNERTTFVRIFKIKKVNEKKYYCWRKKVKEKELVEFCSRTRESNSVSCNALFTGIAREVALRLKQKTFAV